MMVSTTQIIEILQRYPKGLKARRIAYLLNADKKDVNSTLYKNQNTLFIRDDNYIWKLYKSPVSATSITVASPKPTSSSTLTKSSSERTASAKAKIVSRVFNVAGCYYHKEAIESVFKDYDFRNGAVSATAKLVPEPDNKYDSNAIQVMILNKNTQEYLSVGYVPWERTSEFFKYIDKNLNASVKKSLSSYEITVSVQPHSAPVSVPITVPVVMPAPAQQIPTAPEPSNSKPAASALSKISSSGTMKDDLDSGKPFIRKCIYVFLIIIAIFIFKDYLPVRTISSNKTVQEKEYMVAKEYTERTYTVYASVAEVYNDHVGSDWYVDQLNVNVNGSNKGRKNITLRSGDQLYFSGYAVEDDKYPDESWFETNEAYTITKSTLQKGFNFTITDIFVYENDGRYQGNEAKVKVILNFAPQD